MGNGQQTAVDIGPWTRRQETAFPRFPFFPFPHLTPAGGEDEDQETRRTGMSALTDNRGGPEAEGEDDYED